MALTRTKPTEVSPQNPTIITRWVKVKAAILDAAKRHQAVYHGSAVHLAFLVGLVPVSVALEAFRRASPGWYLFCGIMAIGYFYDLKTQRERRGSGGQGHPRGSDVVREDRDGAGDGDPGMV